jgi:signal transduction histidine kinase
VLAARMTGTKGSYMDIARFFSTNGFMPHGHCYLWNSALVTTHVISDTLIGLAYISISLSLYLLIRKIKVPFSSMVLAFGVFIGACGMTHFLEVWNLWHADYWISAGMKVTTAVASVATGIWLWRLSPKIVFVSDTLSRLGQRASLEVLLEEFERSKLHDQPGQLWKRYVVSFIVTTLGIVGSDVYMRSTNKPSLFLSLSIASISAMLGGYGPGFASLVVSMIYVLLFTEHATMVQNPLIHADTIGLFIVSSVFAVGVGGGLKRQRSRAENSEKNQRLLALVGKSLMGDEDYREAAQKVAELLIPQLGDWCMIDVRTDVNGPVERVAIASHNATAEQIAQIRCTDNYKDREKYVSVILNGGPRIETYAEKFMAGHPVLEQRSKIMGGVTSFMSVPLKGRDGVIGMLTVVSCNPRKRYTLSSLNKGNDLATRLALAIENKILYRKGIEYQQYLERSLNARDDFLSIASHELKTPITSLKLQLQMLQKTAALGKVDSQEVATKLGVSTNQINRLTDLIENLLDVTRVRGGKFDLKSEELDLTQVVEKVVSSLQDQAKSFGSVIEVKVGGPSIGHWDRVRVEQIITNLVTNAIKYGGKKPILVEAGSVDSNFVLRVTDRGIGISKSDQNRIFGRFERAASAKNFGGLGLGLYITKLIVEAHGGTIDVESEPGKGSVFTVILPKRMEGEYEKASHAS